MKYILYWLIDIKTITYWSASLIENKVNEVYCIYNQFIYFQSFNQSNMIDWLIECMFEWMYNEMGTRHDLYIHKHSI